MIEDVFKSLHEAVKKRNNPQDFLPHESSRDVIHRGYLRTPSYPIRMDLIPDGKTKNTGKHIYSSRSGILEIDYKYSPSISGHETVSNISFEKCEYIPLDEIEIYRSFIVPSLNHHTQSHNPDVINFNDTVMNADDLIRRLGSKFEQSPGKMSVKRKIDPKISRIFSHIRKKLNIRKG